MANVKIVGAGLAGTEAAWQLAERGFGVELFEMRPSVMTKAHKTGLFAELVCSNSFRGAALSNAVGLLKEELKLLSSLVMQAALVAEVPAGGALAVDRKIFSEYIDDKLRKHPNISVYENEVREISEVSREHPLIIASGPLTSDALAGAIEELTGKQNLAFFDAISPIVLGESLNYDKIFRASRYDKGEGDDYLNIPLNAEEYHQFAENVIHAEKYRGNQDVEGDLIENLRPFEGCMPIEEMLARGPETLLFGPLKPVGLICPRTQKRPHAVIQLRQDDKAGELWSMVGMQTRMKRADQERVFKALPGLEKAEFVRFGTVHRNTFIDSPRCLNPTLEFRTRPGLFFAGQITGVEGYVESASGGLLAGLSVSQILAGKEPKGLPIDTAIGALHAYITDQSRQDFQPMNISFGLMPSYFEQASRVGKKKVPKKERRIKTAERALGSLKLADLGYSATSPVFKTCETAMV